MQYEQLAAREKHTFAVAEDVINRDYPLKLASRRFIQLWNTTGISQLCCYQEDLNASEENREQHTRGRTEIRQVARESGASVPEMDMVHEMLNHQRQQQGAMAGHLAGFNEINR